MSDSKPCPLCDHPSHGCNCLVGMPDMCGIVKELRAEVERLRGIIAGMRDLAKAHLEFVDGSDREHPETIAARAALAETETE